MHLSSYKKKNEKNSVKGKLKRIHYMRLLREKWELFQKLENMIGGINSSLSPCKLFLMYTYSSNNLTCVIHCTYPDPKIPNYLETLYEL